MFLHFPSFRNRDARQEELTPEESRPDSAATGGPNLRRT